MNIKIDINPIGFVRSKNGALCLELKREYIPALTGIKGFSHLQVLWWGHLYADSEHRDILVGDKPYKKGPEKMGIFATRSPVRPNPILCTNIYVQNIDFEKGMIFMPYIDAEDGTPVLDIKPYNKSERVRECSVPDWCSHWPEWDEDASVFKWEEEFNF
jgi:tRNA-Thr(GGU) m(6)t(6)A37 methyltransferase TsaA